MPRLPSLTGKELVAALERLGFRVIRVIRVKGSHHILLHDDGRRTVLPVHSGESIGRGLLVKILRDCDLDRDHLFAVLRN